MKKLIYSALAIIALLAFVLPGPVIAQSFVTANQVTVAWDAVTQLSNGDPLPATDSMEYSVYTTDAIVPDKTEGAAVWRGPELQTVITFTIEGMYWVGVRAHRIRDGTELNQSTVAWSDNPVSTNDSPWGVQFWLPPGIVQGLRPQA